MTEEAEPCDNWAYRELARYSFYNSTLAVNSSVFVDVTSIHKARGREHYTSRAIIGLILGALVCMTVVGNIFVLLAVGINRKLRTPTNHFVVSLAVADLLLGILVLPFSAVQQLTKEWIFGEVFCTIWVSVDVMCCTASIFGLLAISIDRYIGVNRPLQHKTIVTSKRALVAVIALWLASFIISLGPLIGWREDVINVMVCPVTTKPGYVIFSTLSSFYIPAIVITYIYFQVYKIASRQANFLTNGFRQEYVKNSSVSLRAVTRRSMSCRSSTSSASIKSPTNKTEEHELMLRLSPCRRPIPCLYDSSSDSPVTGDKISTSKNGKFKYLGSQSAIYSKLSRFNREKKAAKTLSIVVGVFLICWLPFFVVLPIDSLCSMDCVPPLLFDVVFWLGYCNSLINPVIYATWNTEFRETFLRILKCHCCRKRRNQAITMLARKSVAHIPQTVTDRLEYIKPAAPNIKRREIENKFCSVEAIDRILDCSPVVLSWHCHSTQSSPDTQNDPASANIHSQSINDPDLETIINYDIAYLGQDHTKGTVENSRDGF